MQYNYCGCPVPGETIGQRVSRFVSPKNKHSSLSPPEREAFLIATHPSDHNAVFAFHRKYSSETSQQRRREKFLQHQKRDAKLAKRGKLDPKQVERSYAHDPAFLIPVPLFFYDPTPLACVAYSGNVVNSANDLGCTAV